MKKLLLIIVLFLVSLQTFSQYQTIDAKDVIIRRYLIWHDDTIWFDSFLDTAFRYHWRLLELDNDDHEHYALLAGRTGDVLNIDTIQALDSDGLSLFDDAGNGMIVEDGGNVGIGTTNPTAFLHVAHSTGVSSIFQRSVSAAGGSPAFIFQKSRGSVASPTTVITDDYLGSLQGKGYTGTAWRTAAKMEFFTPHVDDDTVAGSILFSTRDTSNTMNERLRIDHFGNIGMSSSDPQAKLDVNGNIHGDTLRIDSIWENTLDHGVKIEGVKFYDSIVNSLRAIQFTTGYTDLPHEEAKIWWDDDNKTLTLDMEGGTGVRHQVGQEEHLRVVNTYGSTIVNGSVCNLTGTQGQRPTIGLALADTITRAFVVGISTHDIPNSSNGYVTSSGLAHDIPMNGTAEGEVWNNTDLLYASAITAGQKTKYQPDAPATSFVVGVVLNNHATEGVMGVSLIVVPRLAHLSDVNARSNQVHHNLLRWDTTYHYWDTVSFQAMAGDYQLYSDTNSIDATRYWVGQQNYITGTVWGDITGTVSNQADLQTELNGKYDEIAATTDNVVKFTGSGTTLAGSLITSKTSNVGIGSTNPQAVLDVNGDILLDATFSHTLKTGYINAENSGGLHIRDDSDTYGIYIADGGNVGIGSASAGQKLYVYGTVGVGSHLYLSNVSEFHVPGITLGGASDTLILARSVASGKVFYKNASDIGGGGGVGGEANTASNVGIVAGDAGVYFDKSGVDLRFRKLNSINDVLTIAENATDTVVDFTINKTNIDSLGTIIEGVWTGTALTANYVPNHDDLNGFVAEKHYFQKDIDTVNDALSGIAKLTSGVISAITDNSGNWNTAYDRGDWDGGLTTNHVSKFDGTNLINSQIFDDATNIGIGDATPTWGLDVNKHTRFVDSVRFDDAYLYMLNLVQGSEAGGDSAVLVKNSTTGRLMYLNISDVAGGGGGGGGEVNTASSQGDGTSIYFQKSGVDLQFNAIKSENNILGVALDATSHDVELTIDETNIDHNNLTNTHNLTTDIDHNTLTNYVATKHYFQKDIDTVNDALSGLAKVTSGVLSAITDNSGNWNTAYGWGDPLGVYAPIADTSVWTISGNNIYSKNTDNVGIGSTVPAQKLDVVGTIQATGIKLQSFSATTTSLNALILDGIDVKTNDLSDDFGNVSNDGTPLVKQMAVWKDATTIKGFQGFSYEESATSAVLHLNSAANSNYLYIYDNIAGRSNYIKLGTPATGSPFLIHGVNSSNFIFSIDTLGGAYFEGNTGIGDATPTYKLDVNGTFRAVGNSQFDGTLGVTGTLTTEKVQAIDGDGISLYDDGGAGIHIEDGGNVGIGTTDPAAVIFHIAHENYSTTKFQRSVSSTAGTAMLIQKSRGTVASPTAVNANDQIGNFQFKSYHGTGYITAASFSSTVRSISGTVMSADWAFDTRNASDVKATRFYIQADGNIGVGNTTPVSLLDVTGLTTTNTLAIDACGTATETTDSALYIDTDGKVGYKYLGSCFSATKTATKFSTTGTYSKLIGWATDIYDTHCFTWDAGNNELEIDVDGRYMIVIDVYGKSTTTNDRGFMYFTVYENIAGGGFAQNTQYEWYDYVTRFSSSLYEGGLSGTYIADYNDGDKIALYVRDEGVVLDIEEDDARIYVVKIK